MNGPVLMRALVGVYQSKAHLTPIGGHFVMAIYGPPPSPKRTSNETPAGAVIGHSHSNRINLSLGTTAYALPPAIWSSVGEREEDTMIILGFVTFDIVGTLARWIYRGLVRFTRRVWDEEGRK